MCVVSMVSDHFRDRWPLTPPYPGYPYHPTTVPDTPLPVPDPVLPSPTDYESFRELIRKAREYDRINNQPDCPDPEKEAWMKELEERMVKKYGLMPRYAPGDPDRPGQGNCGVITATPTYIDWNDVMAVKAKRDRT